MPLYLFRFILLFAVCLGVSSVLFAKQPLSEKMVLMEKISSKLQAKKNPKVAFLVGGSCDLADNFITEFNAWNRFLTERKWQVRGFVDSSKKTEIASARPFAWEDFVREAENLSVNQLEQVLILIITHGNNKGVHGVCAQDGSYHPVTDLRPALRRLTQNGVQTAVIDMSCYSGYSIGLLENVSSCVMSMAGKQSGSGSITSAVAENLFSLPTVSEQASVEDVWFNVVNHSVKKLRQIPLISGHSLPVRYGGSFVEDLVFSQNDLSKWKLFYNENVTLFTHLFSQEACSGIGEFFSSGKFRASNIGVLGVLYLNAHPNPKDRPCANFYF